eukprot:scaffold35467_cov199-Amphora_coffeaeformis.AAC.5
MVSLWRDQQQMSGVQKASNEARKTMFEGRSKCIRRANSGQPLHLQSEGGREFWTAPTASSLSFHVFGVDKNNKREMKAGKIRCCRTSAVHFGRVPVLSLPAPRCRRLRSAPSPWAQRPAAKSRTNFCEYDVVLGITRIVVVYQALQLIDMCLLSRIYFSPRPCLRKKLGSLSTQALVDGLWVMGWPSAQIDGARPLAKDMKCVGRAVTLNFVPARPDIAQDKPAGGASPEYEAFEKCGPNEVLVMSSVGPWESVGGDIKFLRLKQLAIGGLVTDGSVRDTDEIINYGFPCFSYSTTARQGPAAMQPWECNGVINVSGVTVRPGDAIVGDQDGVVVVPAKVAEKVYNIAHGREVIEDIVKEELMKNPGPPGKFYPFMSGKIKVDSPLGKLLASKGITPENSSK